jgi:hypothetical protein
MINVYRIENIYPDRSKEGAALGLFAKSIIQPKDAVVLDSHDFTSFLFYSDSKMVYELSKDGGKAQEWWAMSYNQLPGFTKKSQTLLITRNPEKLPLDLKDDQKIAIYESYQFFRIKQ